MTSLVGILSAIILKGKGLRQTQKGRDSSEEVIDKFVIALADTLKSVSTSRETNLLAQLETLNTTVKNEGSETREALGDIKTDLAGIHTSLTEGQNETVTQLQNLTTTVSDKHDLLISEFQTFSENVAESVTKLATDELIEALQTVIEDFNKNLTEQFGENFKQLNEAVGKTVEWQEQYRQQMDALAKKFRIAARSVEQSHVALASAADALTTIKDQSDSLVSIAKKLDPILHTLKDQLEAFSRLRRSAYDAFPLIERRLNDLTKGFSNKVKTAIDDSYANMETQRTEFEKLTKRFSASVEASIAESHSSMNKQRKELTALFKGLETEISTALKTTALQLENIVEMNKDDMKNHVDTLDSALRKELKTSLQALAGNLQSLSNGFVKNYEKLVEPYTQVLTELQKLVNAGAGKPLK